ncbi:MAG: DUF481 domain-containing protein [Bacteroidia bacterium]
MAKTIRLFYFITLFSLFSGTLMAQVVNIESQRLNKGKDGLAGTIDLNLSWTHTVTDVLQTGNKIQVQYLKGRSKILMLSDLTIIRTNTTDLINNGFQHLRYNYQHKRWLIWEAFTQIQYNQVQKLDLRGLAGTGPRFRFVQNDTVSLHIGTLYMYEYEELTEGLPLERNHRLSSYVSFDLEITDKVNIDHITYYQPVITHFNDFRVSSELVVTFKITRRLTFGVKGNYVYDSRPPPEIPGNTYEFKNSLGYRF